MTDREKLLALLNDFKLAPATGDSYGHAYEPDTDVFITGEGYTDFYCRFEFDKAGNFVKVGVWE